MAGIANTARGGSGEAGFAAMALVIVLLPVLFLVGSYLQTMSGRNSRLGLEIKEEKAMLAAEAGVDVALYHSRLGALVAGHLASYDFAGTLGDGSSYSVRCIYLGDDDVDNDGDSAVDEPDEDVFQVITTGGVGTSQRRLAAYLGFTSFLPSVRGAVTLTSPSTTVDLGGSGLVSGFNVTLGGAAVGAGDMPGLAIAPPGTLAGLASEVTGGEAAQVVGAGGTPSLGLAPAFDVAQVVAFARNAASHVFTNDRLTSNVGSPTVPVIAYRQGDFRINSNHTGYGLLVVDGNIRVNGNATWHGVIVCTGEVDCGNGSFLLRGGLVLGPSSPQFRLRGSIQLHYSAQAVQLAERLMGRYVAFNGWQEIGTASAP